MTDPRMTPTNDAPVTVERDDAFEDGVVSLYRFDSAKDRDRAKEAIAIALHRHRLAALASAQTYPSLELCVQFSDDGQHIRKWSRLPFDGGTCLYSHPASAPAGDAFADAGKPIAAEEDGATVEFVRAWLMSGDHPVSDWERRFAAAIDARPRAAVGERRSDNDFAWIVPRHPTDAMVQAGLYHCTADMGFSDLFTAFHYMVDEAQQDDAILALQSPPAKVEGDTK